MKISDFTRMTLEEQKEAVKKGEVSTRVYFIHQQEKNRQLRYIKRLREQRARRKGHE